VDRSWNARRTTRCSISLLASVGLLGGLLTVSALVSPSAVSAWAAAWDTHTRTALNVPDDCSNASANKVPTSEIIALQAALQAARVARSQIPAPPAPPAGVPLIPGFLAAYATAGSGVASARLALFQAQAANNLAAACESSAFQGSVTSEMGAFDTSMQRALTRYAALQQRLDALLQKINTVTIPLLYKVRVICMVTHIACGVATSQITKAITATQRMEGQIDSRVAALQSGNVVTPRVLAGQDQGCASAVALGLSQTDVMIAANAVVQVQMKLDPIADSRLNGVPQGLAGTIPVLNLTLETAQETAQQIQQQYSLAGACQDAAWQLALTSWLSTLATQGSIADMNAAVIKAIVTVNTLGTRVNLANVPVYNLWRSLCAKYASRTPKLCQQ